MPFLKTNDIETGDIILEENAWIWTFPTAAEGRNVCNRCFRRAVDVNVSEQLDSETEGNSSQAVPAGGGQKRCAACRFAAYCSKECQVEDWKTRHRYECSVIQKLGGSEALAIVAEKQKQAKPSKVFIGESHAVLLYIASNLLTIAQAIVDNVDEGIFDTESIAAATVLIERDRGMSDGRSYGSTGVSATTVLQSNRRSSGELSKLRQWVENHNDIVRRILPAIVPLYDYADFGATDRWTANRFTRPLALAVCNGELARFRHTCYKPNAVLINEGRLVRMIATEDIPSINQIRLLRTVACDYGAEGRLNRGSITQAFFGYTCECDACTDSVCETSDGQMYQLKCPVTLPDGTKCTGDVCGPPNEVIQVVLHKASIGESWQDWAKNFSGQCNKCQTWASDSYGVTKYADILLDMAKMYQTIQTGVPPTFFRQYNRLSDFLMHYVHGPFLDPVAAGRKAIMPAELEPYLAQSNVLISDFMMACFHRMLSMSKSPLNMKQMCLLALATVYRRLRFVYKDKFALTSLWSLIDHMKMGVAIGTGRDEPGARDDAVNLIELLATLALVPIKQVFPAHQAALIEANLTAEKTRLIKDIDDAEAIRIRKNNNNRRRGGRRGRA